MITEIQIWADSIGKGVIFDEEHNRYRIAPERCAVQLERTLEMKVENHSRMGATVTEGYQDFLAAPAKPGAVAVIAYGGNDCDMPWRSISETPDAAHDAKTPLPRFAETLQAFIAAAREKGMHPLLVTPPPLQDGRYFEWVTRSLSKEAVLRFLGDVAHIYRWQERYSIAVRSVAAATRCPLFDLRDAFLAAINTPSLFCVDGIHPNAQGQALIAETVLAQRSALSAALMA